MLRTLGGRKTSFRFWSFWNALTPRLSTSATSVSASHSTLYAHWGRAVTIAFDPNGGKCDTKKMTFPAGATYSGFPRPTRAGYLYAGWYTAAKGGTRVTGKTVVSASHKKFYAHWNRAVTVAFDANGGTCSTNKMTFRVGATYSDLPRPVREGCLFTGWYTAAKNGTRVGENLSRLPKPSPPEKLFSGW